MKSFKDIAYQILKEEGVPLHSKDIVRIALKKKMLDTTGKTPEATMNAELIVDTNKKKNSRFIKTALSTFYINAKYRPSTKIEYKISDAVSSKQKGDIAEAKVAELITLYGDKSLACYKPISDDEGLDLIVKEKKSLRTIYIQVKSRFGTKSQIVAYVKELSLINSPKMAIVFCFFDTEKGDLWDYVWFVPGNEFKKKSKAINIKGHGILLPFIAGRSKKESNKWDKYLIKKQGLANRIIEQMKKFKFKHNE